MNGQVGLIVASYSMKNKQTSNTHVHIIRNDNKAKAAFWKRMLLNMANIYKK